MTDTENKTWLNWRGENSSAIQCRIGRYKPNYILLKSFGHVRPQCGSVNNYKLNCGRRIIKVEQRQKDQSILRKRWSQVNKKVGEMQENGEGKVQGVRVKLKKNEHEKWDGNVQWEHNDKNMSVCIT